MLFRSINSNKKCVKFWCFDNFLITKANLKLRRVIWNPCKEYTRTGRPDTPSEGIRTTFHPHIRIVESAPPLHPAAAIYTRLPHTFYPHVHIRNSDAGWERRRFKFPEWTYSDYLIAPYPDRRAAILHKCCGILLKLPNICHRHFRIF